MDIDAPATTNKESVQASLREIREFREIAKQMEAMPAAFPPDVSNHFRRMFRLAAAQVMEIAGRTRESLPPEAEEFVRQQFGGPPYPAVLDVMLEDPEFRKQFQILQTMK
jgi:hypothetical protein